MGIRFLPWVFDRKVIRFPFQVVVINASGHLLGRLASVVAKELLKGQHVVCVKCENINISGTSTFLFRFHYSFGNFQLLSLAG